MRLVLFLYCSLVRFLFSFFFFFNDTATTEIYTLSLHDALPILLEGSRPLGSQLLPCIGRMRYVLYGVAVPRRVFRAEVERTQVNRVVRRAIEPMKGDTDKALPLYVFASDVKLDGPVTELDPFEIRHALTGLLVEPNTLPGPIAQSTHAAVEDLDVLGLDGSLLRG